MLYFDTIPEMSEPTAVALGLFDGVHLGHRAVIGKAAEASGLVPTVLTFSFDQPGRESKPGFEAILSPGRKRAILASLGVQVVVEPPFSAIRETEAETFFREVLVGKLKARAIFCGWDHRFGKNAAGDTALLAALCKEEGIAFEAVKPLTEGGSPVSSTRIRNLLKEGQPLEAARLLGEPYAIDFGVSHGRELGRRMGFPTINQLYPAGMVLPRFGVYATVAQINGKTYGGVTNVGVKPSVGTGNAPAAETYLIGFEGDLYGKEVLLSFYDFIRPERKFSSVEALFEQIAADTDRVRQVLSPVLPS